MTGNYPELAGRTAVITGGSRGIGPRGIRVNCLAPSAILTERVEARMPAEVRAKVAATHPLARLGTPQDVADAALFLASDGAGWLTGLTIDVAGGRITN
ncbi:SDR family oxidoreductase [Kitasatospora phosalacinea]|uniref:SDR family oxidoreductase n=1 Tax=Kitasatospora phosalacinea TaxID=2065 RepID=UPI00068CCF64|nr:SDR family oxidoreductase [Kitasatospora phosalacinea]